MATLALHVRDPHESGSWGFCPTRLLTGFDCPGCGGLRAVHDLTDGNLAAAASSNLLLVVLLPLAVVLWARWTAREWTGEPHPVVALPAPVVTAALATVVVFTLLRNLPAGAWLAS